MANKITPISKDSVHKICSGQVVLSLAVALKELIENSLDAQATAIEIRLKEYGSELIEVSDNGVGIHPSNFEALALKHHTSKINDFADLTDIDTFGFRGEALSSLCAVSDMIVTTKHTTEALAHKLIFNNMGVLQEKQLTSRQVGTTVTLTNLFSSLPVRQKEFHRNMKKEFNKAVQLLSAYCLIAANVKVSCVNQTKKGGRIVFLSTQNNKNIRENIACVFGSKQLLNLLEIMHANPSEEILEEFGINDERVSIFRLEGFISSCEHGCGRGSADRQFFYINSRPCEIIKVTKIINEIYHRYNQHQYPFVLLNVTIPKQLVDVNVTPDKRLIFFENEKTLLAVIKSSLIKTFENIPSTYLFNNTQLFASTENKDEPFSSLVSAASKLKKYRHSDHNSDHICESDRKREFPENTFSICKQIKLDDMFSKKSDANDDFREQYLKMNSSSSQHSDLNPDENDVVDEQTSPLAVESALQNCVIVHEIRTNKHFSTSNSMYELTNEPELIQKTDDNDFGKCDDPESIEKNVNYTPKKFEEQPLPKKNDNCISEKCETISSNHISEIGEKRLKHSGEAMSIDPRFDSNMKKCDEPTQTRIFEGRRCRILNVCIEDLKKSAKSKKMLRIQDEYVSNKFHAEINPDKNQAAEEELKKVFTKDMFSQMGIVGQFNLGFIIARLNNDLFIVDQHATDEKYNFEMLQSTTTLTGQKLVVPQDLNLTAANECVLMDNIEVLRKNGFEFLIDESGKKLGCNFLSSGSENFLDELFMETRCRNFIMLMEILNMCFKADATKKVKLVSIPVSRNWQFGKEDIDEMLFMLQDSPNTLCRPTRIRSMFASRACRKSVMIGTSLSVNDMKKLINNMGLMEHPWHRALPFDTIMTFPMLTAKVLVNVLNEIASTKGIEDTVILSNTGEVVAYNGNDERNTVDILSAITSNLWLMLLNSGESALNEDDLNYGLIKCAEGKIMIKRIGEFLLCIRAKEFVGFGLLKKKSSLLEEFCRQSLNEIKRS